MGKINDFTHVIYSFQLQEVKLATIRERKRKLKKDPTYTDYPWELTSAFKQSWIKFVKDNYDKVKIPPSVLKENANWIELIPNEQEPEKTRYNSVNKTDMLSLILKVRWVRSQHDNLTIHFEEWTALMNEYVKSSFVLSSKEAQKQFYRLNRIKAKSIIQNMRPFNLFSMLKKLLLFIFNVIRRNAIIVFFNMFI